VPSLAAPLRRVNPAVLLEPGFLAHTRAHLNPDRTLSVLVEGSDPQDQLWIQTQLARLDAVLDLDFVPAAPGGPAGLIVRQLAPGVGLEGLSLPVETGWLVEWRPTAGGGLAANPNDRHTVVHEQGHALGLAHPQGDPNSKRYTTRTTVMSYRPGRQGWSDWYSLADLAALQQNWNPEVSAAGLMEWFTSRGRAAISLDLRLEAAAVGSVLQGGERSDGGTAGDLLIGGPGADQLFGGSGRDWLTGHDGDDLLVGGLDGDVLIGGPGADRLITGGGADIVASCRDGSQDTVVLPTRANKGSLPLIEALDRVDRLEILGVRSRKVVVQPGDLQGLAGYELLVGTRPVAFVADPWLSRSQLLNCLDPIA